VVEKSMPLSDLHFANDQWFLNSADDLTGTISGQVFCIEDLEIGEEYCFNLHGDYQPTLRFVGMVIADLGNNDYGFMNTQEVIEVS
jgi:hypothetical protein